MTWILGFECCLNCSRLQKMLSSAPALKKMQSAITHLQVSALMHVDQKYKFTHGQHVVSLLLFESQNESKAPIHFLAQHQLTFSLWGVTTVFSRHCAAYNCRGFKFKALSENIIYFSLKVGVRPYQETDATAGVLHVRPCLNSHTHKSKLASSSEMCESLVKNLCIGAAVSLRLAECDLISLKSKCWRTLQKINEKIRFANKREGWENT